MNTLRNPLFVVGLGNQGRQFDYTRHNIGRSSLDHLVQYLGLTWAKHKQGCELVTLPPPSLTSSTTSSSSSSISSFLKECPEGLTLVRLPGFVNLSGRALNRLVSSYGNDRPSILIVHDDLERKFGHVSIKRGGSANGHRGVTSVQVNVSPSVHRLRIGIGRPSGRSPIVIQSYVLSNFSGQELEFFKTEGFPLIWKTILEWAHQENAKTLTTLTSTTTTTTPSITSDPISTTLTS